jgi:hypothetical protein
MEPRPETVMVVLDPQCGEQLVDLSKGQPVWVVDSVANRPVVERLWALSGESISLTLFDWIESEETSMTLVRMLDTIDLHHPRCIGYRVHGAALTIDVYDELVRLGYSHHVSTADGFVASRTAP